MAREVQQDRADRAAVLCPIHDAGEHQDGAHRFDAESQRQKDGDGCERAHARQHADHVADEHADEAPHDVMRLERDAEAVPQVGEGRSNHRPLHVKIGIGICRRYENSATPKNVTKADRMSEPFSVASRSPIEATNTQAKVPGAIPKYAPNSMKASGEARIQPQASHSRFSGRMSSSSPSAVLSEPAPTARPRQIRSTPSAVGRKPGPICIKLPRR